MTDTIERLEEALDSITDAIAEMRGFEPQPLSPENVDEVEWFEIAQAELGVKEIVGDKDDPRVLEYLRSTSLGKWARERDETPWCSAFVNWCMQQAGIEGTGSAGARSWLGWGVECEPKPGAIAVLRRGDPPKGHVAFVDHVDGSGGLHLLGGNQRNAVRVSEYDKGRVLSYRWPAL